MNSNENSDQPREMLTVEQAAERLSVSRTTMFSLIKEGAVNSVLVGRYRRVPASDLAAYIASLSGRAAGPDHAQ